VSQQYVLLRSLMGPSGRKLVDELVYVCAVLSESTYDYRFRFTQLT
jgi:hypothetical protein